MEFWKKKKKCPVCGRKMTRKGPAHICSGCGTKVVGDTQIRPAITVDDIMRIWR